MNTSLPVVVIGAGPVGLAAAVHLLDRGLTPLLLEQGETVGQGMLSWAHVRMFSPWAFNIDGSARARLERNGWEAPEPESFPTGGDMVARYLRPLAALPEIRPHLRLGARVTALSRHRRDRMKDAQRKDSPFLLRYQDTAGEHEVLAQAVIDASGTMFHPNPLGASGIPALGEQALHEHIFYGMPDVLDALRERYAGRRVLVVGSGHSAFNVLNDLTVLARNAPGTRVTWALRNASLDRVLGGGANDQLVERGRLGKTIGRLVEAGTLEVATGFELERLESTQDGIVAYAGERALSAVDEVIACTGFRPDLTLLSELRVDLDPGTQSPRALAPMIDPNLHSCGTVRAHGAMELAHPDPGFYIVGMKSYGRAPTFLLITGYEQVRSVAAAIAGDWKAARRVELVLPETGVCSVQFAGEEAGSEQRQACCGGPPRDKVEACCRRDEDAKREGKAGCGCGCGAKPMPEERKRRAA